MQLRKILIIDDSDVIRRMHSIFLKPLNGTTLICADNGRDGLSKLVKHRDVDLIILDLEMPEMSGMEFLAARRRDPFLAEIPVLVVSSLADSESVEAALNEGAVAFVAKPFSPDDFYEAIGRAMGP